MYRIEGKDVLGTFKVSFCDRDEAIKLATEIADHKPIELNVFDKDELIWQRIPI